MLLFSLRCDRLSEKMGGCEIFMECVLLRWCWKVIVQQEAKVSHWSC